MRKNYCIIFLLGMILLAGCQKIKDLTTFRMRHDTEVTIPGQKTGISGLLDLTRVEVSTSSEQTFQNNDTRAELVEEVSLDELALSITEPENQNFDFLNEINIYIKAEGEEEVLLASKTNIPEDNSRSLELETTGTNLRPYVIKDSYSIRTAVKTDKVLDQDVGLKIDMTFKVRAKVF